MPLVHPIDVVSFSSEDPHHPASNLLNRETYRKWKCKEAGEKEAFVILKFEKAVAINCIDIGNDGSALVEVSVARSGGNGDPQFEAILNSTAFMSPLDSREGKNMNGVKSFSLHSLSKPIAAQKWDLVKVLVSQPFNRHVQYGLTFMKFTAAPDPNEPQKIGIFGLRKPIGGDSDEDNDVKPGNLFTSLVKSPKTGGSGTGNLSLLKPMSNSSTNAAIREATDKIGAAVKSSSEEDVKELLQKSKKNVSLKSSPTTSNNKLSGNSPLLSRKKLPDAPLVKQDDRKKDTSPVPNKLKATNSPSTATNTNKSSKKRALSPSPSRNVQQKNGTSKPTSTTSTPKKVKKAKKTKPFNKLFEGVVFSMSGFENPLRGQLRDHAIQMGGRYRADWDNTCTHLICAFYNTPKFRQVKGKGKIVKKDWIEKSYSDKCRYPWRRFCLDRNDNGTDSEEEIHALEDNEETIDDEEIETETNNADQEAKSKRKRAMILDSSDESDSNSKKAYDADTDVDEDKTPDLSPSLMDGYSDPSPFFESLKFHIPSRYETSDSDDVTALKSIIVKHKGSLQKSLSEDTDYFICHSMEWEEDFTDALSDNPNLIFIDKKWIFECDKEDQLIDKGSFMLFPS